MIKFHLEGEQLHTHGTNTLKTERLLLRRHRPEDAALLYETFGTDASMSRYSGWNPFATPEMAEKSVRQFISSCEDPHFYGWAIERDGDLAGTIGAYDYKDGTIEVGFSIAAASRGQGFAGEALQAVLAYLTEHEEISRVIAWCAADNTASKRTLENAGMKLVKTEAGGLRVGENVYDQLYYGFPC